TAAQPTSILIVEDEKEVRDLLRDVLTDYGHCVKAASNGKEALQLFSKHSFDMVFTDLGMPGMSGWDVAREIKNTDRNTPVIMVTGWKISHTENELKNKGVDLIINKPFQISHILEKVQVGLTLSNAQNRHQAHSNISPVTLQ
ncbi:MAG: response regulator, partial [Deltaproteobacteria bacterium]|nr:response regulator [Deltaproteobacteria bacterium]